MQDEIPRSVHPAPAPVVPQKQTGRRRWVVLTIVLLLLVYAASPYYAFWRFTVALRTHDAARLEAAVDFQSLRKSMKQQLNAKVAALRPQNPKRQKTFDSLSQAFGSSILDGILDTYLTPEGLAAFLADPKAATKGPAAAGDPAPAVNPAPGGSPPVIAPETNAPPTPRRLDWSRVRYAFFTGPRDFLVDFDGTKLQFRFNGWRWRLNGLELDVSKLKI